MRARCMRGAERAREQRSDGRRLGGDGGLDLFVEARVAADASTGGGTQRHSVGGRWGLSMHRHPWDQAGHSQGTVGRARLGRARSCGRGRVGAVGWARSGERGRVSAVG